MEGSALCLGEGRVAPMHINQRSQQSACGTGTPILPSPCSADAPVLAEVLPLL